jgi:hypothetical protein
VNFILKIVKGPNSGAEIALVSGTTVSFGSGESCDIVLSDQTLPEKIGELLVEDEQVSLRLPDGAQEKLVPLQVKVVDTTAFAVGPADSPWGSLVWPEAPDAGKEPSPPPQKSEEEKKPQQPKRSSVRWLLWTLVVVVLVALLELLVLFFWQQLNDKMRQARRWFRRTSVKSERVVKRQQRQTLEELAETFGVEADVPAEGSQETPKLRGNLKRRADRLKLTALAYDCIPGLELDLTDDESLRASAEELLHFVTEDKVKVTAASNRRLELSGELKSLKAVQRMLEAIQADMPLVESVDCSHVTVPAEVAAVVVAKQEVAAVPEPPKTEPKDSAPEVLPRLPVVGVLMTPYPCLVMRDGSRVLEGAEFHGFIVSKISNDAVELRKGETVWEWKP